jgi:hypothetical protein
MSGLMPLIELAATKRSTTDSGSSAVILLLLVAIAIAIYFIIKSRKARRSGLPHFGTRNSEFFRPIDSRCSVLSAGPALRFQ